jgi:hypothetical protein
MSSAFNVQNSQNWKFRHLKTQISSTDRQLHSRIGDKAPHVHFAAGREMISSPEWDGWVRFDKFEVIGAASAAEGNN